MKINLEKAKEICQQLIDDTKESLKHNTELSIDRMSNRAAACDAIETILYECEQKRLLDIWIKQEINKMENQSKIFQEYLKKVSNKMLTAQEALGIASRISAQETTKRELEEVMDAIEMAAAEGKDELCYPDNLLPQNISLLEALGYKIDDVDVDFTWICWRNLDEEVDW